LLFYDILACLHDQNKSGFFEGPAFSSQSKQLKKYSKNSGWLEKSRPTKNHFCFDHVNRLFIAFTKKFIHSFDYLYQFTIFIGSIRVRLSVIILQQYLMGVKIF